MDKILIFGHKNPDTDSVCGTIALSYLKNKMGYTAIPYVLGNINDETKYALSKFRVEIPKYLNDVKPKLKDVNFHKNYLIDENKPINDAINYMTINNITGLPLIDKKKTFKGYVSLKEAIQDILVKDIIEINTTFTNIISTLNINDYVKIKDNINGYINTHNFANLKNVNEFSIIIVNDTKEALKFVKLGVHLIIIVNSKKINKEIKNLALKNKVNVMSTDYSLFKVAKMISLSNPIKSIKRNQSTITFKDTDYLSDFLTETSKLKHTNYPILDKNNLCLGMLRTIDAHEVKKHNVILVDHNSMENSADGIGEASILEIVDHHNIGDINTKVPVNFRSMSVGSVNTIIYHMFMENKVSIPKYIAGIMLSGILSDTLLLNSPTTTDLDKSIAASLAKIANIDIEEYGLSLLSSGVSIENSDDTDIIYRDFKTYKVNDNHFAIAQVFTTDFKNYKTRIDGIVEELDKISESHDYKCCCLYVTNFLTNNSYILFSSNSKNILELAYKIENIKEGELLRGVVSRKKQIIPYIMNVLDY